jgi:hypothetical protein
MPTIKGPITFKKGVGVPKEVLDMVGETKLPFTATGFTFTNQSLNGKKFKYGDGTTIKAENGKLKKLSLLDNILG